MKEPPKNPLPEGVEAPGLGPRKLQNIRNQLRQWGELCGAEFSPKAREMRRDPRLLMQASLVAKDAGRMAEFHMPAYRARWADARDISDPAVVADVLAVAGLDAEPALAEAESDAIRDRLEADSSAAIERGVFGAPTIFVGDEMFWGNDQFELVRYYLQKALAAQGARSAAAGGG